MEMHRRTLLQWGPVLALPLALGACGFRLRSSQAMAFQTIAVTPENGGGVAGDLSRYFGDAVRPVAPGAGGQAPEVILDILQETRAKNVVGVSSTGQVREFQLILGIRFRLRTPKGRELITATDLEQRRDISFNESAVLAKEAEEALLYRDMQADMVQQIVRRVAAVKSL